MFMASLGHAMWRTRESNEGQGGAGQALETAAAPEVAQRGPTAQHRGGAPWPSGSVAAFIQGDLQAASLRGGPKLPPKEDEPRPKLTGTDGAQCGESAAHKGTTPKAMPPAQPKAQLRAAPGGQAAKKEPAPGGPAAKGGPSALPPQQVSGPRRRRRRTVQRRRRGSEVHHGKARGGSSSRSRTPPRWEGRRGRYRTGTPRGGAARGPSRRSPSSRSSYRSRSGGSRSYSESSDSGEHGRSPSRAQGRGWSQQPGRGSGRSPQAGAQGTRGFPRQKAQAQGHYSGAPKRASEPRTGGGWTAPREAHGDQMERRPRPRGGSPQADRRHRRSRERSHPSDRGDQERGDPLRGGADPDGGKGKKGKGKPYARQRPPRGVRPGRGSQGTGDKGAAASGTGAGTPWSGGAEDRRQRRFGSSGTDA